jgi:hypothetical protein
MGIRTSQASNNTVPTDNQDLREKLSRLAKDPPLVNRLSKEVLNALMILKMNLSMIDFSFFL